MSAPDGEAFECYLDQVLATAPLPEGAPVLVPRCPRRIQPNDVERALDNPRALFSADQDEPRERLRALFCFALWLRYSPPGHIPARLASRAARFRFGVWSLPPRLGWPQPWRSLKVAWSATGATDYAVLSRDVVLAEARAARDDWLAQLNDWEDDPWLAARHQRDPGSLEADLRWVTTTWPRPPRGEQPWPDRPGYLDLEPDGEGDRGSYHRVATDLTELHWLPRGSLGSATATLLPDRPGVARLLPWVFPLVALIVVGLFAATFVQAAAWAAVGLLMSGVAVAGYVPSRLTGLALLRVPAAAAVGLVVLMSLTPRWWLAPWGWTVGAGLLLLTALYLVLELRLHGAARRVAYSRGLGLATIAAGHAFVLSLLVLTFVAPVMAERGECLAGWWSANPWAARTLEGSCAALNGGHAEAPAGVLVLMTGWSLAVGLAAQILWDDRPVTAPLGRLRRVRGATR
ncbi:MAG: hypothetical protein ABR608_16215 [Pseudonocardiaceae bacterium]